MNAMYEFILAKEIWMLIAADTGQILDDACSAQIECSDASRIDIPIDYEQETFKRYTNMDMI